MRKLPAALAAVSLAALTLTGCTSVGSPASSFDGETCERSTNTKVAEAVTVTGEFGKEPKVTVPTPLHVASSSTSDVIVGEGRAVSTSSQLVAIDVALYNGTTGKKVVSTEFNGDLTRLSNVSSWEAQIPGLADALKCASAGSRVVAGISPSDVGEQTAAGFNLAKDDSLVAVIDVLKVFYPKAEGALQFNGALGLPTVVRAEDGRPGIIVPDATAPSDLVVQTLIKGDGPVVSGESAIRVHYTGVTWNERTVFDSSWDAVAARFDLASVIPGFAEGLTGQTVGSQVLIVVPPEMGYGDQAQGEIPANSTLVFVVDILGVDSPSGE